METKPLTVCLCLTNPSQFDIPLTQIAGGHVFGPYQRLKLVLQGFDNDVMADVASCIQDCCFPLVEDISTTASPDYDVIVVFLPIGRQHQMFACHDDESLSADKEIYLTKTLVRYAIPIGDMIADSVNDMTQTLVLGDGSNLMASLLSQRLGGLGGNRLLAFQPEVPMHKGTTRSQYQMANILCQTVSDWWAGIKRLPSNIKAGVKFFGKADTKTDYQTGFFLSVPVEVEREVTFRVCPVLNLDNETVSSIYQTTSMACQEMRALRNGSHADMESSLHRMSCL